MLGREMTLVGDMWRGCGLNFAPRRDGFVQRVIAQGPLRSWTWTVLGEVLSIILAAVLADVGARPCAQTARQAELLCCFIFCRS